LAALGRVERVVSAPELIEKRLSGTLEALTI